MNVIYKKEILLFVRRTLRTQSLLKNLRYQFSTSEIVTTSVFFAMSPGHPSYMADLPTDRSIVRI